MSTYWGEAHECVKPEWVKDALTPRFETKFFQVGNGVVGYAKIEAFGFRPVRRGR